jgi:hypothetical protein
MVALSVGKKVELIVKKHPMFLLVIEKRNLVREIKLW